MFFYFYVIVENGKTIQLYQTIKCINLIFLTGIDMLFKMYKSNLKGYCDTDAGKFSIEVQKSEGVSGLIIYT